VTDWTDMPWRAMRDPASIEAADAAIDAMALALDEIPNDAWREERPAGGALSCWTAIKKDADDVEIAVDILVEHPVGGLCRASVDVEHAGITRTARIVCDPELIEHLLDDPQGMIGTVSRLLTKAVETTDCMPTTRSPRMDHAGLDAEGASMLVEEAERCGMDPSAPVRIETWGPCPMSRSVVRTTGSGLQRIETMLDDVLSSVKLSAHADRSVWLSPLISTVDSDGFDAMQLLQIHRAIAERVAA